MPSLITMKKRVPPRAQSNPNVAEICIHSALFSGILLASIPDNKRGIPRKDGKNDVTDPESDKIETATPHKIKNPP